ncbi:MAG: DUF4097 family beta strand repeat protein [Bacilli bacterium]|nr:DUF4097 family beta strand repeat protein [Bacilli bacterium]
MKKVILCLTIIFLSLISFVSCNGLAFTFNYQYADNDKYSIGTTSLDEIEKIDIDWVCGKVYISSSLHDENSFFEEYKGDLEDQYKLRYYVEDKTLYIKYAQSGKYTWNPVEKDLHINFSKEDSLIRDFNISLISADLFMNGVSVREMDLVTVSGDIELKNSKISNKIDIESVSGNVEVELEQNAEKVIINTVSGDVKVTSFLLEKLSINTVSGDVEYFMNKFDTTGPKKLEIETVSGDVNLYLKEATNATIDFETTSGMFLCQLDEKLNNGKYVLGNGNDLYDIETTSGDFIIKPLN